MWQKERLLNLAVAALPPGCTKVAGLDSDLVFRPRDWPGAPRKGSTNALSSSRSAGCSGPR